MKAINKITGEIFDVEECEDNRDGGIYYKRIPGGRIYPAEQLQSLRMLKMQLAATITAGLMADSEFDESGDVIVENTLMLVDEIIEQTE